MEEIFKRLDKLEEKMRWWIKAHIKLQEQHITLQKKVYEKLK